MLRVSLKSKQNPLGLPTHPMTVLPLLVTLPVLVASLVPSPTFGSMFWSVAVSMLVLMAPVAVAPVAVTPVAVTPAAMAPAAMAPTCNKSKLNECKCKVLDML